MTPRVVLTVAGTDSGGAAGIAADLATFGDHGAHGACVVTAVTAQDTTGVQAVHPVPVEVASAQLDAVLGDLPVAAVKTGMLGSPDVVGLVADRLAHLPLVVDPVLAATSGAVLGDLAVARAYVDHLLPRATLATPNLAEARALAGAGDLAGRDDDAPGLAARLADLGCAVVVTGGPQWRPGGRAATCTDWLCLPGATPEPLSHGAVPTTNDHGTGCTFSSAVTVGLARTQTRTRTRGPHGGPNDTGRPESPRATPDPGALRSALRHASAYVAAQLTTASTWDLGRGRGPVAHTRRTPSPHAPSHETTHPTQEEPA